MKKGIKYLLTGIGVAMLRSKDPEIADNVKVDYAAYGLDVNNKKDIKYIKMAELAPWVLIALLWPLTIVDSLFELLDDILEKKFPKD